jgi:vacuolar iron transporter family protein
MPHSAQDHFHGKTVPTHLKEARIKGAMASAEIHGTEISGRWGAFADALKDTALAASLLWILLDPILSTSHVSTFLFLFLLGWTVWKTCRSACFGWARLERLHRLIEEERWEIQHHRQQEKEELIEIYRAKGFEGDLLDQAIDTLMADDNRLLQIMLEEELGLSLESHEHPLKQASGAFLGSVTLMIVAFGFHFLSIPYGFIISSFFLFLAAGIFTAKIERISLLPSFIWNVTIFLFTTGLVHLIKKFLDS